LGKSVSSKCKDGLRETKANVRRKKYSADVKEGANSAR